MTTSEDTKELAIVAARAAHEKLATDIALIDVSSVMDICEIFVVASADTNGKFAPSSTKSKTNSPNSATNPNDAKATAKTDGSC